MVFAFSEIKYTNICLTSNFSKQKNRYVIIKIKTMPLKMMLVKWN